MEPSSTGAYTATPLHVLERGAESSNLCDYGVKFGAVFASVVAKAGHVPKMGDGVSWGRRMCRAGVEVDNDYPEPTCCMPKRHDITNAAGGAS